MPRLGGQNDLCSKARSGYNQKDAACVADSQQGETTGRYHEGCDIGSFFLMS